MGRTGRKGAGPTGGRPCHRVGAAAVPTAAWPGQREKLAFASRDDYSRQARTSSARLGQAESLGRLSSLKERRKSTALVEDEHDFRGSPAPTRPDRGRVSDQQGSRPAEPPEGSLEALLGDGAWLSMAERTATDDVVWVPVISRGHPVSTSPGPSCARGGKPRTAVAIHHCADLRHGGLWRPDWAGSIKCAARRRPRES